MKLLSSNIGYLLDYTGHLSEYALAPHRAIVGSESAERRAAERLVDVIAAERPDIVSLVEVDQGSARTATNDQTEHIATLLSERGLAYATRADTKYGDTNLVARLPVLRHLSNGLLLREGLEVRTEAHYLDTGPKRLVTEVAFPTHSVFAVHLAMGRRSRQRQLEELGELIADRDRVVVCGDFNVYRGVGELDALRAATGLQLHDPGESVPKRPLDTLVTDTRSLDLFLSSPDIAVTRCDVIDVQVSDHRPVVLEFEG